MRELKDSLFRLSAADLRYLLWVFLFAIAVLSVPAAVVLGYLPRWLVGPLESALLIIVTFAYLLQTKVMADEMREERKLSRKTLQEMRKEQGLDLIVHVIEPLISDLENHRSSLRELDPSVEKQPFPTLQQMLNTPEKDLLEDLEEEYPNAVVDISEYQDLLGLYQERFQQLLNDLERHIEEECESSLAEKHCNELEKAIDEEQHIGENQTPESVISANSRLLGRGVLELDLTPKQSGAKLRVWRVLQDDLLELRSVDRFKEEFEEIEMFREDLEAKNEYLLQKIKETEEAFLDRYEINRSEVREKLEQVRSREENQSSGLYTF